jgi:hypothetical protein
VGWRSAGLSIQFYNLGGGDPGDDDAEQAPVLVVEDG